MSIDKPEFSLREKKYAKTKLELTRAFIRRMENQSFEDISVKEVCEEVMVSEGTFFNYFPSKIDVIYYFTQLHHLYTKCEALRLAKPGVFLDRVDKIFEITARNFPNPRLVYEIISAVVREKTEPAKIEVSRAEKYFAYPDCEGIMEAEDDTILLHEFIKECLRLAVDNGEFTGEVDIQEICLSMKTLIVGLPLAVKYENYGSIKEHYGNQLNILWKGYGRKPV